MGDWLLLLPFTLPAVDLSTPSIGTSTCPCCALRISNSLSLSRCITGLKLKLAEGPPFSAPGGNTVPSPFAFAPGLKSG